MGQSNDVQIDPPGEFEKNGQLQSDIASCMSMKSLEGRVEGPISFDGVDLELVPLLSLIFCKRIVLVLDRNRHQHSRRRRTDCSRFLPAWKRSSNFRGGGAVRAESKISPRGFGMLGFCGSAHFVPRASSGEVRIDRFVRKMNDFSTCSVAFSALDRFFQEGSFEEGSF